MTLVFLCELNVAVLPKIQLLNGVRQNVSFELEPQWRVKQIIGICWPLESEILFHNVLTLSADMSIYHRSTGHCEHTTRNFYTSYTSD